MIDRTEAVGYGGAFVDTALAVIQSNEILQVIQIILSIIAFIITISYTIYKWYKKATDDNSSGGKKITRDEINDLLDDLKDINKEGEEHGDRD